MCFPSGVDRVKSGAFSPTAGGAAAPTIGSSAANTNKDINVRFKDSPLLGIGLGRILACQVLVRQQYKPSYGSRPECSA
jgi:hypothetical protein